MTDLHLTDASPTAAETAAVDSVLDPADAAVLMQHDRLVRSGKARRDERRHLLLPVLHALQAQVGWISEGGLNLAAERLGVPPAEAYGVATFYDMFRTTDPGHSESVVHVCSDAACLVAAADDIAAELAANGRHVHRGPCLGQCERAPATFVQGRGEPDHVPADATTNFVLPQAGNPDLRVLARVGVVDPASLADYRANGGYRALAAAAQMGPQAVIEELTASGLSGRGGAAFPIGIKWQGVANEPGPTKHVVANCDESEPGTFKDRVLMENDPFALVEALTIAGVTTGAEQGWIYVRGEYPLATSRLQAAIDQARQAGLLGLDAAGTGHSFDLELRRGAGAYICGEETALFNSIEGKRGEPRNKPPFPTSHGLFGQPTAINNPETLFNVLDVVNHGAAAYRGRGTEASPGTRLFCVSGAVANPGVYEFGFGTTLGELLEAAGGVVGVAQAVLLGGAAGSFVGPDSLDLKLSIEHTREAGTTLGSGVVMVFDTSADMAAVVTRIAEFFRNESCGQCVPCRVGTVRQHEVLVGLNRGGISQDEATPLIDDMALAMADASICGLGHTASGAVQSALRLGLLGAS